MTDNLGKDLTCAQTNLLANAALVAVGTNFGLVAAGSIGSPAEMTIDQVTAGLRPHADNINADMGG